LPLSSPNAAGPSRTGDTVARDTRPQKILRRRAKKLMASARRLAQNSPFVLTAPFWRGKELMIFLKDCG
jgi:hypothetical protein